MGRFKILSIDGGGIREILPAYWLSELEDALGKPIRDVFDLFAGTSAGAIIAAGIAGDFKKPRDILDIYKLHGATVFPSPDAPRYLRPIKRLRRPKYSDAGLNNLLTNVFETKQLGAIEKRVLIASFDAFNRRPLVFDNAQESHKALPIRDACKASASAPTYFPSHVTRDSLDSREDLHQAQAVSGRHLAISELLE